MFLLIERQNKRALAHKRGSELTQLRVQQNASLVQTASTSACVCSIMLLSWRACNLNKCERDPRIRRTSSKNMSRKKSGQKQSKLSTKTNIIEALWEQERRWRVVIELSLLENVMISSGCRVHFILLLLMFVLRCAQPPSQPLRAPKMNTIMFIIYFFADIFLWCTMYEVRAMAVAAPIIATAKRAIERNVCADLTSTSLDVREWMQTNTV